MPMGGLKDARRIKGEAAEQALVREIESEIKLNPGLAAAGSTAEELATSHRIFGDYARHREAGFPNEGAGLRQASKPLPKEQIATAGDDWMGSAIDRRKEGRKPLVVPHTGTSDLQYLLDNLRHLDKDSTQQEMLRIMRALEAVSVPTEPRPLYQREPEPEGGFSGFPSGTMKRKAGSKVG